MTGTTLGSYVIEGLLGTGGMGAVYRARDTRLGRSVAIKVLPDEVAFDPQRTARFEREGRVLASLNHPNIAALYGMELVERRHLLIMELVEGETLAERLAGGPIAAEEALRIARQIGDALEAAHALGIVHRDLKPANVKITPDDKVKVLDFGLAKAMDAPESSADGHRHITNSPTLSLMATQAGMILGTAAYMSPEQAKGHAADHRSDIFSFGVVLYEMLVGRTPFAGETAPELLAAVLLHDVDLTVLAPDLNPGIAALLRRCLDKNPKRRWQAIGDVNFALEELSAAPRSIPVKASAADASPPSRRRALVAGVVVGALVAAAGAAAAWRFFRPSTVPGLVRFQFMLPEDQVLTRSPSIAVSPDGLRLAYAANNQIYLRRMDEFESRPIPGTDVDPFRPFFSPDGAWVGFFAFQDGTLKKVPIAGGFATTISKVGTPTYGASWYGDSIVFAVPNVGVLRVPAAGGEPSVLLEVKAPEAAEGPLLLDDDTLVYTRTSEVGADRWDKAKIIRFSISTGASKVLVEGGTARFVSANHLFYIRGTTVVAVPFDGRTHDVHGVGVPLLDGVRRSGNPQVQSGISGFAVAASGSLVYLPGGSAGPARYTLALVDGQGKVTPLPIPPGPYAQPRISPDGQRLAVSSSNTEEAIVWIYGLKDGGPLRRLTFGGRSVLPVWSPDSRYVAFQSDREGTRGIWRQLADGSGPAEQLTTPRERTVTHSPESWSPDGRTLLFRAASGTAVSALWTLSLNDRSIVRFDETIAANHSNSAFSPDGRWVAYGSMEGLGTAVPPKLFVQPFPRTGAKYQITTDIGSSPRWSRDGKRLFYDDGPNTLRLMAVNVTFAPSFGFGSATAIAMPGLIKDPNNRSYDITHDGSQMLILTTPDAKDGSTPTGRPTINVVLNWLDEVRQRVPD